MKIRTCLLSFAVFSLLANVGLAVPCSYVLSGFSVGSLAFTHAQPSNRKPLLQIEVTPTGVPDELKTLLGANAVFHAAYSVVDTHFTVDASVGEITRLREFTLAATLSRVDTPDTCFVVWYAPSRQQTDFNVVLDQVPGGRLLLGSNNKADGALYMTLTPPTIR